MKKWSLSALVLVLTLAVASPAVLAGPQDDEDSDQPSLYDRLGGVYPIALVVDDLINRVAVNEVLNANPAVYAARAPERYPGLKFQLTAMVCQATGGPCEYTGKSMKEAHEGMNINGEEWAALAADFKASLDKYGVPEAEQKELFAIVESTRGDIVASSE